MKNKMNIKTFLEKTNSEDKLLDFMSNNIHYGFLGKNNKIYKDPNSKEWQDDWYKECIVQSGESLILTSYGTCWDQVELERLWFEKNGITHRTIFMWFETGTPSNLPTHTFLIYKKNKKWYWFENAFEANRGIFEFNNEIEAINYVKQKQLEYAIDYYSAKIEDLKILKTYEYSKPSSNLGVEEFFSHVIGFNKE